MINLKRWFYERTGAGVILDFLKKKQVPDHRYTFWYYLGGLLVTLIGIQIITGGLLLLYYKPTMETAYESVSFITKYLPFGSFLRSLHSWCSNFIIAIAFIHMLSTFFLKSYRPSREFVWISGTILMFILLTFGFSGYLLPWNMLSLFATGVGTQIAGSMPVIGKYLLLFLRGGEYISGDTLTRFFALHVIILPLILLAFIAIHVSLIQYHGMSVPPSVESSPVRKKDIPFYPDFLLYDLVNGLFVFSGLVILALFLPKELGVKADLLAPAPAGIKPEWYFLFMFETLKLIPGRVLFLEGKQLGVMIFALGAVFLICVPFLDRWSANNKRNPLFTSIGFGILIYIFAMTAISYLGK
jgi:cytochrome b6